MRIQTTPEPLPVSRSGVLFVSGCATSLRVERGHLVVRSGQGRAIREGRFARVSKPRLRRVVIYGKGGFTTWDALEWIDVVGAAFAHLSRDGRVVATSGSAGPNQPALRRSQVIAAETEVGLEIVRFLLTEKLDGQLAVLRGHSVTGQEDESSVSAALDGVKAAPDVRTALAYEAKAASVYWGAWREVQLTFAQADRHHVPAHWLRFGERQSALSTSARKATTPSGAILNYLYALAEFEARLSLLAVGLDPGLGWAHRDAAYRDSAALDLMEAMRPSVDEYVRALLGQRTFARREFVELPTGQVRLLPSLAKSLAEAMLPSLETQAGAIAYAVARVLSKSTLGVVRTPNARSRGVKGRANRGQTLRPVGGHQPRPIASACRTCGLVLNSATRVYCDDCLPSFVAERTAKLVDAAKLTLAQMRSSSEDPAKSPQAKARRVASVAKRKAEARDWERANPGPHDADDYIARILPGLVRLTLPAMMRATGLSSSYCWKIRRGERIPHPMYWELLNSLTPA